MRRRVVAWAAAVTLVLLAMPASGSDASIHGSIPAVPERPTATAVFIGGVDLQWNDVPGSRPYDVQMFSNGRWIDLPGDGVDIAFYGAGAIIIGLDPGSMLLFRVRARNGDKSSDWSEHVSIASTSQYASGRRTRPNNVAASGAPVVNGKAQVGETLTADTTGIGDGNGLDKAQFRFQWLSGDGSTNTDIAGAMISSYTLATSDEGKTMNVRVSFTDRGGYAESLTAGWTDQVSPAAQANPRFTPKSALNSPASGAPTIAGTAQVGKTLTADVSGITDADGLSGVTFSYQWVANDGAADTDITGATVSTYTLAAADEGKTIKVRVSFTDDAANGETLTSAATSTVEAAPNSAPEFATSTASRSIEENSIAGKAVGGPVVAIDADGDPITYTLDGPDKAFFSIDVGGQLSVAEETILDYESRETYTVEVIATDLSGGSDAITVTITVVDVIDPNIVLIVADDVGYEVFGANGSRQYSTPEIDNLAYGGVRFTNAHSKPCCAASRVALMTGKSNVRNYVDQGLLPRDQYLIVDPFREAGYATAIAGKWRLHGFTRNNSGVAGGDGFDTYCLWGTANTTMDRYGNASVECDGEVNRIGAGKYAPDFFVDFLLDFMESNQNRPFFAYYPMVLAHAPYAPPPGGICQYRNEQCSYEEMVAYMDGNVGLIYDKLEELELLDNTIVVFTSDNGTPSVMVSVLDGETIHGDRGTTTDISTHAPLFVHVPGGTGGRVVDDLIDFTDFLPTLADAAGLTIPNRADLDGVSFWDRLEDRPGQPREWLYTYYFPRPREASFNNPGDHPEVSYARDKQYKLYHTGELFDVSADPHELYPLPDDDQASRDIRAKLQAVLDSMPARGQGIHWPSVTGDYTEARPRWRPVLSEASVNEAELVLTYAGILKRTVRPETDAFVVKVDGAQRAVSTVAIDSSTVTLTLDSPVSAGQTVTISYTPGTNAIQHAARSNGHKAAALSDEAVHNLTGSNSPAGGSPAISGTAKVGETLTADTSGITDADGMSGGTFDYQWVAVDGTLDTDITGATDSTYVPVTADEGKAIKVRVSFTDDANNQEVLTSASSAFVQGRAPDTPNRPAGNAVFVGGVDLEWNDVPGADSYDVQLYWNGQWMDLPGDGIDIAFYGAGAIISGLDPLATLWFQVRAGNSHGSSGWSNWNQMPSTSQSTLGRQARPENETASGAPVISGTAQVGETLTANTTAIQDGNGLDRVQFRFQWVSDDGNGDTDIAGATDAIYALVAADEGNTVKVRVSFTDRVGYSESLTSTATASVISASEGASDQGPSQNNPATGAPAISGTVQVGETLTADPSGIADADGLTGVSYSYQWIRNDGSSATDIPGATGATYALMAADEGKTIKVKVSFTDDVGNDETLTSAATSVVAARPNSPATGAPTISGTARVGETLTADTSWIADSDGLTNASYSYQWISNDGNSDSDIGGATDSAYVLVAADEDKAIKVRVSFTDDANHSEVLTSVATAAVAARPNSPATGAPTVTGTAQVGEMLTADTSGIADADGLTNLSYSYQWLADDADIAGATSSTYVPADGDVGKAMKVRVTFTDDANHSEVLTSAATGIVNAPLTPLTVSMDNNPTNHNGTDVFTFEIRFSEEFPLSFRTLKFHAFTVTGGTVKKAQRQERGSNIGWTITVEPDSSADVTVVLPATTDCEDSGAICTQDGRMLSNGFEITVLGSYG